jgi:nucleotide-binding universal stress UspA family protein
MTFRFQHILFPVDYSGACSALVPYVREMQARFGARLSLLHVASIQEPLLGGMRGALVSTTAPVGELLAGERGRLAQFAAVHFPGVAADLLVEPGDPATVIAATAQKVGADLIMMGTHGGGFLRRFLLGSVAGKVLHDTDCAVWTGAHLEPHMQQASSRYEKILCALGDPEERPNVLAVAKGMAEAFGAKLSLIRVVEPQPFRLTEDPAAAPSRAPLGVAGAELRMLTGSVADVVESEARDSGADLVVVGRGHWQRGISRMWSHLYSIVRESPCPVLSVPPG